MHHFDPDTASQYIFTFTYGKDGHVHMDLSGKGKKYSSARGSHNDVDGVRKQ